jgi:copper(I)-binding protein
MYDAQPSFKINNIALIRFIRIALLLLISVVNHAAFAASPDPLVQISEAWVRETNPGQSVGAAYMTLTSPTDMQLVAIESAVSASIEMHSMVIEKGVMKMRMLEALPLLKNQAVKLAPGGLHIMLFDLKAPLTKGQTVAMTLVFQKVIAGKPLKTRLKQSVQLTVKRIDEVNNKMKTENHQTHDGHEGHHH